MKIVYSRLSIIAGDFGWPGLQGQQLDIDIGHGPKVALQILSGDSGFSWCLDEPDAQKSLEVLHVIGDGESKVSLVLIGEHRFQSLYFRPIRSHQRGSSHCFTQKLGTERQSVFLSILILRDRDQIDTKRAVLK